MTGALTSTHPKEKQNGAEAISTLYEVLQPHNNLDLGKALGVIKIWFDGDWHCRGRAIGFAEQIFGVNEQVREQGQCD
jgi:hypothetical protein